MPLSYIYPFIALVSFGLLGIFHKVADHPACRPRMITMLLLFWAAILTALYTGLVGPDGFHHVPVKVYVIGAAAGVLASLALFAFQASLRYGKISTSWLVVNLSVGVPVAISVLAYGERVNIGKAIGFVLVLVAILLLWWDKKTDLERTGSDSHGTTRRGDVEPVDIPLEGVPDVSSSGSGTGGTMVLNHATSTTIAARSKWLPLILLAFLGQGLASSSQKVIGVGAAAYTWPYLFAMYAVGFALFGLVGLMQTGWPNVREIFTTSVMAIVSVAGNYAMVAAMAKKVPGSIAYPVGNGGSLFLVVLAGVLIFREHISRIGLAGIAVGISAVLVLVMS